MSISLTSFGCLCVCHHVHNNILLCVYRLNVCPSVCLRQPVCPSVCNCAKRIDMRLSSFILPQSPCIYTVCLDNYISFATVCLHYNGCIFCSPRRSLPDSFKSTVSRRR